MLTKSFSHQSMIPFHKSFSKGLCGGDISCDTTPIVVKNNDALVEKRNDDDKLVQKKDEVREWLWANSMIMDSQDSLRQHFHSNNSAGRRVIPSYKQVELEDPLVLDPFLPTTIAPVCPIEAAFLNEYDISDDDDDEQQDADESFRLFLRGDRDNSEVVDSSDEEEEDSYYADSDDSELEYAKQDSFVSHHDIDELSFSSDQWSLSSWSSSSSSSQPVTSVEDFDDISVLTMDEFGFDEFELEFEVGNNKAPQDAVEDLCLVEFLVELCNSSGASMTSRKALYELAQARE
jgi:hypothetical protein